MRVAVAILLLSGLAGCLGTPVGNDPDTAEWDRELPLSGGHGVRILRIPLLVPAQGSWNLSYSIQVEPAVGSVEMAYYYSVFTENAAGRDAFNQNLAETWTAFGANTASVVVQGTDVFDNRQSNTMIAASGGGHLLPPGAVDLVFALAFIDDSATTPAIARLHAGVQGPGASFGPVTLVETDRAGYLSIEAPKDPQAHACVRLMLATACSVKTSLEFTTEEQTLVAWSAASGVAGHAAVRIAGTEVVADCSGNGEVAWAQAVVKEPGTWTVDVTLAGAGSYLAFVWPRFYAFWADVPAVLREGVDDPGC